MKEEEAIRTYFGEPGFARFLRLLERQYRASGEGVRGYVTLPDITEEERRALDGFYRTYSPPVPGETKRYSVKKFERLLKESRFDLTVSELLELLNGEPILTRREQTERVKAEWQEMLQSAMLDAGVMDGQDRAAIWARGLLDETSQGARILKTVFSRSPEEAKQCLKHCLAALKLVAGMPGSSPIRLPVLAASVTGDAHALDWKNPLGRLFWWALISIHQQPLDIDSNEDHWLQSDMSLVNHSQAMLIREGYRRGGVADDDLSSQVMLYAPCLFGVREERVLTLRQVEQLDSERLGSLNGPIYMVENPSVFAELIDADAGRRSGTGAAAPVIVCGNGQPTTAVTKLLDTLIRHIVGPTLYYAGDLDPAGLTIAQNLQSRFERTFRAWRMNRELYLRYWHRGIPLTDAERARLREFRPTWDAELSNLMLDKGAKLHQELWVEELRNDLLSI